MANKTGWSFGIRVVVGQPDDRVSILPAVFDRIKFQKFLAGVVINSGGDGM